MCANVRVCVWGWGGGGVIVNFCYHIYPNVCIILKVIKYLVLSCICMALLSEAGNSKTRGHIYKLKKEQVRKPVRQLFYSNRNALPDHVAEAPSVNAFKGRLDKHWQGLRYCIHPVLDAYNQNKSDIDRPRPDTGF